MTASAGVAWSEDVSASTAYRFLWLAVWFDPLAFGANFAWDRRWHATHPFEDFLYLRARTP